MSPVKANTGPFVVVLGTDSKEAPKIEMVEKGIDLVAADQFAPQHSQVEPWLTALASSLTAAITILSFTLLWLMRRTKEQTAWLLKESGDMEAAMAGMKAFARQVRETRDDTTGRT
jgi:hypothetical protein